MTAQNPLKLNFQFYENGFHLLDVIPEEELRKYNRHAFLAYQWGVWCTAWARWELQRMIDISGDGVKTESCFIYADTDSVKYTGEIDIDGYNREQMEISKKNGGFAEDSNGKTHYLGVYEREHDYDRFITWGAKRYAYEQDGEIYVTTAGVVKRQGNEQNLGGKELKELGGLEAYKPGVVFRKAGGTEAIYNDNIDMWVEVDGHKLHITDNVSIRPSSYTLGITGEYDFLLDHAEMMLDLWEEYKRENPY